MSFTECERCYRWIGTDLTRRGFLCATALGVMGLAGCSFTPASSEDESAFKLLGAFVIEPTDKTISAGVDFSSIPDTRKLVMCVFDIENSTDKNWGGSLSCTMSYGSGNDYKSSIYDQTCRNRSRRSWSIAATRRRAEA